MADSIGRMRKSSRSGSATAREKRPRRVFAVVAINVHSGQRKLAGILKFFNERLLREEDKWDIDILRGKDAITDAAMRRAVREGVSGIILLNYPSEATMRLVARSAVPCVVETAGGETHAGTNVVRIVCDAREVAREAATNLAVRQSFASFGYVNAPEGKSWSGERGEFFREALAERGLGCAVFPPRRRGLGAWLSALARPAAICAANDPTARAVAAAALAQGLRIPDDIAVLGIDDDPKFCLAGTPTLSSVVQDFESCGYQAAEALQRLMDGDASGPATLRYGARGVSIRESTLSSSPYANLVQRAFEYIDANACDPTFGVDAVAEHLGVSRRLLDMRFRQLGQKPVHAVLLARRLEQARLLLERDMLSIETITSACGFVNRTHLKKLFKATFGCSMRDWRSRNRDGESAAGQSTDKVWSRP